MADNRVGSRALAAVALVLVLSTPSGFATENDGDGASIAPAGITGTGGASFVASKVTVQAVAEFAPWIHPDMPAGVALKVKAAFEIAVDRVREIPECSNLFSRLGADALEILRTGLYLPTNAHREMVPCKRSLAQTIVGSAPTWICRNITAYPDETVAAVLIHEALHHAGLTEDATGRTAKSSGSITRTVTKQCRLNPARSGTNKKR
jgi:hypothetical protein